MQPDFWFLLLTVYDGLFQIPTFAGDVQRTVRSALPSISAQNVNLG